MPGLRAVISPDHLPDRPTDSGGTATSPVSHAHCQVSEADLQPSSWSLGERGMGWEVVGVGTVLEADGGGNGAGCVRLAASRADPDLGDSGLIEDQMDVI